MQDWLLALTTTAYVCGVLLLHHSIQRQKPGVRKLAVSVTAAGAVLHLYSGFLVWVAGPAQAISILSVFSLCSLVVVILLLVSPLFNRPLFDAALVALPIAATAVMLEWLFHAPTATIPTGSAGIGLHVFTSVTAFGVLSVASVYALFVALIDRFLKEHHLNRLIETLPALEVLETLLFQLIAFGFALLTVSLGSGLVFISDLFAQHLVHKTVLSILAWLVFGALLWGRKTRGWRGRVAVRLTLAGIALLLLSYFGSKLVLEILLERHWQS